MGQGVIQDVAGRLVDTFAENLAAMLEGGAPAAAAPEPPPAAREQGSAPSAERERPDTPPPPPPRAAAPAEEALDLGSLGGAVIADRLQDPRRLLGALALVALVAYLLGRRSAR